MIQEDSPRVVEVQSFLSSSIDLKRLLRDVSRQSRGAVDALVGLLSSQDEKVRLAAAKTLLELNVNVASAINEDALKRLIAETKLNSSSKKLVDSDSDVPLVDFGTVRTV